MITLLNLTSLKDAGTIGTGELCVLTNETIDDEDGSTWDLRMNS